MTDKIPKTDVVYANQVWYVVDNETGHTVKTFPGSFSDHAAHKQARALSEEMNDA